MVSPINSNQRAALPLPILILCCMVFGLGFSSCDSPLDSGDDPLLIDTLEWTGVGPEPEEEEEEEQPQFSYGYLLNGVDGYWRGHFLGQPEFEIPDFWTPDLLSYSLSMSMEPGASPSVILMDLDYSLQRNGEFVPVHIPVPVELGPLPVATSIEIDIDEISLISASPGLNLTEHPIPGAATVSYATFEDDHTGVLVVEGVFKADVSISVFPDFQLPDFVMIHILVEGQFEHPELGPLEFHSTSFFQRVLIPG